jgi:hypothetical protein
VHSNTVFECGLSAQVFFNKLIIALILPAFVGLDAAIDVD